MLAASKASIPPALDPQLREIQSMLFSMGADLAQQDCGLKGGASPRIGQPHVDRLTDWIHRWEADLPPLKEFILPGGDRSEHNSTGPGPPVGERNDARLSFQDRREKERVPWWR